MLSAVKQLWQKSRGEILKREYEDSVKRISNLPADLKKEVQICAQDSVENFSIKDMSQAELKVFSCDCYKQAKQFFKQINTKSIAGTYNITKAYAAFMIGAYLESSILPGDNAKFVHESVKNWLQEV